jgi:nucleotide-binding universal stress UspA family protein
MTYHTIMVNLDLEHSNEACLRIAGDLAEQFNAKLIGIAAASLRVVYSRKGASAENLVEWQRTEITKRLADAEEQFRYAAKQRAREIEWRSAMARPEDYVAREARAADLVITGANQAGALMDPFASLDPGDLVMQAGRPVLVVPSEVEHLRLKCAMVAWKDTREARRAVSDALPLLQKVQEVVVVEVIQDQTIRTEAHARLDDVITWLGRHGISAVGRVFDFPEKEEPLEKLWQYGADFLVAGAYGRAPFREWIFGGFTHGVLRRSRQCSFLAH